jgi:hypothetical protein
MDENLLYHYDPETKQQSMEWRHRGSPRPKNSECKNPLENCLPRFFWDQFGILLIDYLPTGQTINTEYYSSLLVQLKDILKEKSGWKFTRVVLFLHENAPIHRALATQKKLEYLFSNVLISRSCQIWRIGCYFPDLAPSDYHLFPGLIKQLKCRHFRATRK